MGEIAGANAEVSIQTRTETRDASGSIITTWPTTAYNLRAYVQPNRRQESRSAGSERQAFGGIARLPGYASVNPQDRIIWGTHTLQVNTIEPSRRVPEIVDFYHVEWEEFTNAGL